MEPTSNSFVSTNFYFMVAAFISTTLNSLNINVDPTVLESIVTAIENKELTAILISIVGAVSIIYNSVKNSVIGKFTDIFKDRNWYTALIMLVGGLFAFLQFNNFPVEEAEQLTDFLFSGNISMALAVGWAFINSIIKMIQNRTIPNLISTSS